MITPEINSLLKNLDNFRGVYARDEIPQNTDRCKQSIVFNYDAHNQVGSHWVCVYVDDNGVGNYFDSYGLPPLAPEFLQFLSENTCSWNWNKIPLQCDECTTCGQYCCAYLILRNSGYSEEQFLRIFTTSTYTNDYIIKSIFDSLV